MGQVLHRSATTTEAVRRTIQHSQESMRSLARRHGINPKTVAKWKKRESTADRRTGPTIPRSTVLIGGTGSHHRRVSQAHLVTARRLSLRSAGYDPSTHSLFPASVSGASRHQPLA